MVEPPPKLKTLMRFPPELSYLIRDSLELHDLHGHVCLHLLTRYRLGAYGDQDDGFWRTLCRVNGIGIARDENENGCELAWEEIAIECAEHAWKCQHPVCGEARLAENGELFNKIFSRM